MRFFRGKFIQFALLFAVVATQSACSLSVRKKIKAALGITTSETTDFSFQGKWLSDCVPITTGFYGKAYLVNDTEHHGTIDVYFWGTDPTCSGGYLTHVSQSTNVDYPTHAVTGVDDGYYAFTIDDHDNPGAGLSMVMTALDSDTIRGLVISDATIPGATFADWKVSSTALADFVNGIIVPSGLLLTYDKVSGPPTISPTAVLDGTYESDCWDLGADGGVLAYKIKDGTAYTVLKVYTGSDTCAGTYSLIDLHTSGAATDYVASTTSSQVLSLTGAAAGIYGFSGYEISAGSVNYSLFYKPDADHVYLMTDDTPVTTNPGTAIADWNGADADFAGFIANPTTYNPGGDIFTVELHPVQTLHSANGKWLSQCWEYGGGNYGKLYEVIQNNHVSNVTIYSWGADNTCSGAHSSTIPITTDMDFAWNVIGGVPANFSTFTTTDHDNGDAQKISVLYQTSADTVDSFAFETTDVTTEYWDSWKAEYPALATYASDPTASNAAYLHFSRVSGPPTSGNLLTAYENQALYWASAGTTTKYCNTNTFNVGLNTYQSYHTYSMFLPGNQYAESYKLFANSDCTGASIYYDSQASAEIASPELTTKVSALTVITPTGMPSGIAVRSVVISGNTYYLLFNTNGTHLVYAPMVPTAPVDPNTWTDYETAMGAGNMASFLANPDTYNATFALVYVP